MIPHGLHHGTSSLSEATIGGENEGEKVGPDLLAVWLVEVNLLLLLSPDRLTHIRTILSALNPTLGQWIDDGDVHLCHERLLSRWR